jgi:hypothetical protein
MPVAFDALRPLLEGLPPIVMLSSLDGPGAGDAALRLQRGLVAAGAAVTTYVLRKTICHNPVLDIDCNRKMQRIYAVMGHVALRQYTDRPPYFELFSLDKSPVNLSALDRLKDTSLVHLNWMAGMLGFPQATEVLEGKSIVWSLMDMNPLTGGCHCTAGCEKYMNAQGCKQCPQLGIASSTMDLAAQNFSARKTGYAKMNMAVVAHATWLTACSKQSRLLGSFPHATIPTCVDPCIFFPLPRSWARAAFGISPRRKVIIFGASGIGRRNKGLHILNQALEILRSQWTGNLPLLLVFGGKSPETFFGGYESLTLGRLAPSELARAYSAADVFVLPSFQDNLPNTANEALACGTPVVCFNRFSSEDVVINGVTGFTAKHPGLPIAADGSLLQRPAYFVPQNALADFADKIRLILTMPSDEYESMRIRCSTKACEIFSPVLRAAKFLQLYRCMLGLPNVDIDGIDQ